jgi:hypothetical protein
VSTILSLSTAASLPVEHASSGGNYAVSTLRFVLAYFKFRFVRRPQITSGRAAILDGPLFYELMRRRGPFCFFAFDLLWLDARDLRDFRTDGTVMPSLLVQA